MKSHSSSLEDDQAIAAVQKIVEKRKPKAAPAPVAPKGFVVRRKVGEATLATAVPAGPRVEAPAAPTPAPAVAEEPVVSDLRPTATPPSPRPCLSRTCPRPPSTRLSLLLPPSPLLRRSLKRRCLLLLLPLSSASSRARAAWSRAPAAAATAAAVPAPKASAPRLRASAPRPGRSLWLLPPRRSPLSPFPRWFVPVLAPQLRLLEWV